MPNSPIRIDLRSDTVTKPTDEMRRAMAAAEVGDDVYGDDPTVNRLEETAAARLGKPAALYVPSGTMANLVAVLTHTTRGDEVVLEADSHIYYYEVGGLSAVAGTTPRLIHGSAGHFGEADVRAAVRGDNIHFPAARLLCLENTHNRAGGTVWPTAQFGAAVAAAHELGLRVHLDGARIFNAAVALGVPAAELAAPVDSVMFCLSKGLSAPVGSLLVGERDFIAAARKQRKRLGGGMRQAGIIAAAGLVALEQMVERLADDHANARRLAEGLANITGVQVDMGTVQTNMVMADVADTGLDAAAVVARLAEQGVGANVMDRSVVRFVTHKDVSAADIESALPILADIARGA